MILTFTDFGYDGPYMGEMRAALIRLAPGVPAVDLMADAPRFAPKPAGYLLAALARRCARDDVFVCVVDPGVGTARRPVVVAADEQLFVGPDNGLFAPACRHARRVSVWRIDWRPVELSASFHGRDLFAPVAARLALGAPPPGPAIPPALIDRPDWPDDLAEVIYIDGFGNAVTGLRAARIAPTARLTVGTATLAHAETFGAVPVGAAFWYENAHGLVELAVNQGRADRVLGLSIGVAVCVLDTAVH